MEIGLFRDIQKRVSRQRSELFRFRKKRHTRGMKLFNISSTSKIDLGPPCRLKGPSHYVYVGSFRCHLCTEYPWELICSSIEPPSLSCKILNIVAQEYLCARFMFVGASAVSPLLFLLLIWLYPKHTLQNFTVLPESHISEFHCAAPISAIDKMLSLWVLFQISDTNTNTFPPQSGGNQ